MTVRRLRLKTPEGWLLPPVERVESPNCDPRPFGCIPEVVIIHAISLPPRRYGGRYIDDLFTNRLDVSAHSYFREIGGLRVSAHFLVRRDGRVAQFVPVGMRAWHAGVSVCLGRERVNDFSIGVELEGCDEESFALEQYNSLSELLRALREHWPRLGPDRWFGHSDIAPGRKTDPGPNFEWSRIR